MKMGEIRQLYPDMKDSLDEGVFFEFKKYYQEHQEDILQALIQDRQKTIVTHTGQEILCTLQQFHGKEYTTNSYGHEYHILLEGKDRGRFGCHVEHRIRPVTGELRAQGLYPSSRMVNNRKFPRASRSLYTEESTEEEVKNTIPGKLNLA